MIAHTYTSPVSAPAYTVSTGDLILTASIDGRPEFNARYTESDARHAAAPEFKSVLKVEMTDDPAIYFLVDSGERGIDGYNDVVTRKAMLQGPQRRSHAREFDGKDRPWWI